MKRPTLSKAPWRRDGLESIVGDFTEGVPSPYAVIRDDKERWVALVEVGDLEGEANAQATPLCAEALDMLDELREELTAYGRILTDEGRELHAARAYDRSARIRDLLERAGYQP